MSDITEASTSKFFSFEGKNYSRDGNWGDKDVVGGYPATILGREVTVHPNDKAKSKVKRGTKWKIVDNPRRTNWFIGDHDNIHQYPLGKNLKSNYIATVNGKRKLVEAESYDKMVQAIGEIWYGAEWNSKENKFEDVGNKKHNSPSKMKVWVEEQPQKLRGWGAKNIKDAIDIIKGFDKEPSIKQKEKTTDEMEFGTKKIEVTSQNYEKFKGIYNEKTKLYEPVAGGNLSISNWRNGMKKDKKSSQTSDSLVGSLYAFLSVIGRSGNPEWLTVTLSNLDIETRMDHLVTAGRQYQHWVQTLYTPTTWWKLPFDIEGQHFEGMPTSLRQVEDNLENARVKHVMPSIWYRRGGDLPDGTKGDEIMTQSEANDYAGYSSVKAMKHAIASYISSEYGSPKGYWKMSDQPSGAFFSRGVPPAKYGTIGKDLTPEQVQKGMEFLRTGINPDIEGDVPENHYNNALSFYEEFGSPYGELAPANMFFRVALSGTGWRKQEAVTCQTQELASYPADEDKLKKKLKSGIYLDKELGLGIKFMTRKTAKYDVPDHTSNIPPFSADLIDTTATINMVLKQANIGQISVVYDTYQDKETGEWKMKFADGYPKFEPATEEQKKEWHPAQRTFKYHGQTKTSEFAMNFDAGHTPKVLVGADGQFLPVDEIEYSDQTKESTIKWDAQMERAYLYFPFKEMYAVMEGTGVKIRAPSQILKVRDEDNQFLKTKLGKKMKPVYNMFDKPTKAETMLKGKKMFGVGWATTCGSGCSPKFVGKIAVGYNNIQKMNQDDYRYDDESGGGVGYWISRPAHSIRHVFAQTWLNIFDWNYGLVADYGHWQVMETLKDNYGTIPKSLAKKQIAEGFAKTFADSKKAQDFAKSRSSLIEKRITDQSVENLQEQIEGSEPVEVNGDEDE